MEKMTPFIESPGTFLVEREGSVIMCSFAGCFCAQPEIFALVEVNNTYLLGWP
jgi:hypothetical protein